MNHTKLVTRLTLKQLFEDLTNQDLPESYRNQCSKEYFKRIKI